MASWKTFADADPAFAAVVRGRFEAHLHHVLGTIRPSGAPRLSGTEVDIGDEVRLGMMPHSRKLADVSRDPRVEVHSAPLETSELAFGDARLTGRLVSDGPTEGVAGHSFVLDIERVTLIRVEADELVVTSWTPEGGTRTTRRT